MIQKIITHRWTALAAFAVLQTGCAGWKLTHTPPGQSVELALAKKATPIEQPAAKPARTLSIAVTEPSLPAKSDAQVESVADLFTIGCLCMEQGHYADAITAFEKALKLDPTFTEALSNLAVCYQNSGQQEKAVETFRKYKTISSR